MFEEILEKAQNALNEKFPITDLDYVGEDGFLYCHKCHTRKQAEVIVFGKHPRKMCQCETEIYNAEQEKERLKRFNERVKVLRTMCFNGSSLANRTFANDDGTNPQITNAMRNYVDNFDELARQGKGLVLYGSVGTGKTYYSCMVANALVDKGYKVFFTSFPTILNELQSTFDKQDYIENLCSPNLLIIDDLGVERDTPYAKEQVYYIIDYRYNMGLPTIFTTNMSLEELKNVKDISGKRVYERILEKCHPIEVNTINHRRKNIREDYQKMQDLLFGKS